MPGVDCLKFTPKNKILLKLTAVQLQIENNTDE